MAAATTCLAVGDVDGDGRLDIAAANRDGHPNAVWLNTPSTKGGPPQFVRSVPYGTGADNTRWVAFGDIDGDGHLDLVLANLGFRNSICWGDGHGGFAQSTTFGAGNGRTRCVVLADLDADGHPDIVVGNDRMRNAVFLNAGGRKPLREQRMDAPRQWTYGLAVGDVTGDGTPNIVTANAGLPNTILGLGAPPAPPSTIRRALGARAPAGPPPAATAAQVLALRAAKDTAGLTALARTPGLQPWIVADELVARGEHDAAAAFAALLPEDPDTRALPAYLEAARAREPEDDVRGSLRLAEQALGAMNIPVLLMAVGPPDATPETVARIRLATLRNEVLRRTARFDALAAGSEACARAAASLGWPGKALEQYRSAGSAYERLLAWEQGLACYEAAAALHEQLPTRPGAWRVLERVALCRSELGRFRDALEAIKRAQRKNADGGSEMERLQLLLGEGVLHAIRGSFRKAQHALQRARDGALAEDFRALAAEALVHLARVHARQGRHASALAAYDEAQVLARSVGEPLLLSQAVGGQGVMLFTLGDREAGRARLLEEQELLAGAGRPDALARSKSNTGVILSVLGDREEGRALVAAALAYFDTLPNKSDAVHARLQLGQMLWMKTGAQAEALAIHERALKEAEPLGDRDLLAWARFSAARSAMRAGDLERAYGLLREAESALHSLRSWRRLVDVRTALAELHVRKGEHALALAKATQALEAHERTMAGLGDSQGAQARAGAGTLYGLGAFAAVREQDVAAALTFVESGRAGALLDDIDQRDEMRRQMRSLSPELLEREEDARAREKAARAALDRASRRGQRARIDAAKQELDAAQDVLRQVAGQIQRALKQRTAHLLAPGVRTIEDIQGALAEDQALVLYGLLVVEGVCDEAVALVLQPEGARIVSLGRATTIKDACAAFDGSDADVDPTAALATLRKLLTEPLKLDKAVRRLLVSPEGALCYVPFAALFDRAVTMTPSGTTHVVLREERRPRGKGVLALGAPDYAGASPGAQAIYFRGSPLAPLPASKAEAEAVGTTALTGADATESALAKALAASAPWRALHLACHGLVNTEKPMLSALALSKSKEDDGFLTVLDVLHMEVPADLAVLSACDTARGKVVKGEGIVGLTRAFMYAGAPRVICSLWKVDDEATSALMVKFYELWNPKAGAGLPAAEALQKAQAHVRSQPTWSHPYYWAAWTLWGLDD